MSEDIEAAASERTININMNEEDGEEEDAHEEGVNNLGYEESEGTQESNEQDQGSHEGSEENNDRNLRVRFENSDMAFVEDTSVKEKPTRSRRRKRRSRSGCCRGRFEFGSCTAQGCGRSLKKYLWEGKDDECWDTEDDFDDSMGESFRPQKKPHSCLYKYWIFWAFFLPCFVVLVLWLAYAIKFKLWDQFEENYKISITVVFGAIISGGMSWSVGAVLYPMMVLGFGVTPIVTRDALLLIQAVGRISLSTSIILLRHKVERHAVIICSIGGTAGIILGLEVIDPLLTGDIRTVVYMSCWMVFGFVLFVYCFQRYKRCPTRDMIVEICCCRAFGLLVVSFAGGILTSISGVGLDMFTFAALAVYFRIHSTVAGTTAVLVMASGSAMGFYWREVIQDGILQDAWIHYNVAVPVLVVCLPVGYILHWHIHNLVLAVLVIILNSIALVTTYAKIEMSKQLVAITTCILIGGLAVLLIAAFIGVRVLRKKGLVTSTPKKEKLESKKTRDKHSKKHVKHSGKRGNGTQEKTGAKRHRRRHVFLDYVGADLAGDLQKPGGFFGREWEGGHGNVITFKELDANESDL